MDDLYTHIKVADYHDDGHENASTVTYAINIQTMADYVYLHGSDTGKLVLMKKVRDLNHNKTLGVGIHSCIPRLNISVDDPLYEVAHVCLSDARKFFRSLLGSREFLQVTTFMMEGLYVANIVAPRSTINYLKLKIPQKSYEP